MMEDISSLLLNTPLLVAIADYLIFGASVLIFVQNRRKAFVDSLLFLMLGLSFLFIGYVNSLTVMGRNIWLLKQLEAGQTFFWACTFTAMVARIAQMRKLLFLVAVMAVSVVSIFFAFGYATFYALVPISYYIAGMAFFVIYDSSSTKTADAGIVGLFGCFLGILTVMFAFPAATVVQALVTFIFLAAFMHFLKSGIIQSHMVMPSKMDMLEENEDRGLRKVMLPFAYIFCYALLLNVAVFMATVGLHEGGHLLVGNLLGCEGGKIVLVDMLKPDSIGPYTEMRCPENIQLYALGLSGFALAIPFGLFFLLLRMFPEKNFFYVVIGMSIVLAGIDVLLVIPDWLASSVMLLAGALLVCVGEVFLINDYIGLAKMKGTNALLLGSHARSQARGRK